MSEGAPSSSSLQPEELLAHATWVQRLARSLVAGEDRADDVAQETWLQALRAPPADRSDLRRWLTRVAQNVARKLARGDARREQREARAPSPSPLPTPEEAFERAALQRRVVDAVLALDETYRAALLLRFFEDLAPSDVARALGIPVETARTRIKRGLEQVRARFAAPGELERALAPLLVGMPTGVAIMTATIWKLGTAAAVVAAAAWWVLREEDPPSVEPSPVAAASRPDEAELNPLPTAADAVRATDATALVLDDDRVLLHGFVVDSTGALVPE